MTDKNASIHSSSHSSSAYQRIHARFSRLGRLAEAEAVLHWDMAAMMPPGGAEARGEQLAVLRALRHEMLVAPETGDLLAAAEGEISALDSWRAANLALMRKHWIRARALPSDLVEALSRASSACETAWREARPKADFALVRPYLEKLLVLVREQAQLLGGAQNLSSYDALLDLYEPGLTAKKITPLFDDLAAFLPGFLDHARSKRKEAAKLPEGPFPADKQRALGLRLMERMGFDFTHGRLDASLHPFCGGTPDDVRITTRYDENDFLKSLLGVLHETGHALYERGLPTAWRGQPVGEALGMSLHESQSLIFEMQACRSQAFCKFLAPLAQETFGGDAADWSAEKLYQRATRLEPGFIRVDADEVSYPAHVILRTRLEQDLIADRLPVADLPEAWNARFHELLGSRPPTDREGCLQDIHWYDGAFGYFPTYTLGAMTAAQLFAAARAAEPDVLASLEQGDFAPLLGWLRKNVHAHGSSRSAEELLIQATGRPLDAGIFKAHLQARYAS